MKIIMVLSLLVSSFSAFSGDLQSEMFKTKVKYEKQAYQLKVMMEKELVKYKLESGAESEESLILENMSPENQACVDWVYRGSSTREQAARACQGVLSVACLDFVYAGSATREASAVACRGVSDMECVKFVYRGSATREEAARSCARSRGPGCY